MADKTSTPSSGAASTDAFRGVVFFATSVIVVVCFFLQALPLGLLSRSLGIVSAAAYRAGFLAACVAHGYRVAYTLRPKLAAALSAGLQTAAPTLVRELLASSSFLYLLYCSLFLLSRPTALALMPVAFHALLQALTYLTKNPPASPLWQTYGVRSYDALQAALPAALGMCASAQTMIGITMLFTLFTANREVLKTMVYWNVVLRGFYNCQDATIFRMKLPGSSSVFHKQAWQALDAKAQPLTSRVPALQQAKGAAAAWFRG